MVGIISAKKLWVQFGIKNAQVQDNGSTGTYLFFTWAPCPPRYVIKTRTADKKVEAKETVHRKLTVTILNNCTIKEKK